MRYYSVTLKSGDGYSFEITGTQATQSETIMHLVNNVGGVVDLPLLKGQHLGKVVEWLKQFSEDKLSKEQRKFFYSMDIHSFYEMANAAEYLCMRRLLMNICLLNRVITDKMGEPREKFPKKAAEMKEGRMEA